MCFQVTILEARSEIGGRVCDDESLGVCVAKGAQILNGAVNNPITIICEQVRCIYVCVCLCVHC